MSGQLGDTVTPGGDVTQDDGSDIPAEGPSTVTPAVTSRFKYKYKEAFPAPEGVEEKAWDKAFTSADSRLYNKHGKNSRMSATLRAAGETRELAMKIIAERAEKVEKASIATPILSANKTSPTTSTQQISVTKIDSTASRGETPAGSSEPINNIADKVKGKARATKKPASVTSSQQDSPAPSTGFGASNAASSAPLTSAFGQMTMDITEPAVKAEPGSAKKSDSAPASNKASPAPSSEIKNHPAPAKKKPQKKRKKAPAAKASAPGAEVAEDSEADSSNDGGEYCICRGPDDHRKMIACDACDEWYHCSCVGVKEADILLIDKYICEKCVVPDKKFTTWKPMCRLEGCRQPCRLDSNPPSKYCSDEHKKKWAEDKVSKMPDGPEPSRGGAITKGELKAALAQTKGDVNAFHALGKKPTLPTGPTPIDWSKVLTTEEKGRLAQIALQKVELSLRAQGFKDKEKVVRMAMERLKKVTEENKELMGACGWDKRLAMNQEEFSAWRNGPEGAKAFETGVLDGDMCDKKRCQRHLAWVKMSIQDTRFEDLEIQKQINKLRLEEHAMQERANTREASKM